MTIHALNCLLEALSIYIVNEQYLIIVNLLVSIFLRDRTTDNYNNHSVFS